MFYRNKCVVIEQNKARIGISASFVLYFPLCECWMAAQASTPRSSAVTLVNIGDFTLSGEVVSVQSGTNSHTYAGFCPKHYIWFQWVAAALWL